MLSRVIDDFLLPWIVASSSWNLALAVDWEAFTVDEKSLCVVSDAMDLFPDGLPCGFPKRFLG